MNFRQAQRRFESAMMLLRAQSHSYERSSIRSSISPAEYFLRNYAVRLVAVHEAMKTSVTADQRQRMAEALVYDMDHGEPVKWEYKSRSYESDGTQKPPRKICKLRGQLKAVHILAKYAAIAQLQAQPHLYNWRGRGIDRMIAQMRLALKRGGSFVISADVRECWSRVNPDAIYALNLFPEAMVQRALDTRNLCFSECPDHSVLGLDNNDPEKCVPHGLMEGSPASNAIFSALTNDLPESLPAHMGAYMFSDNVVVVVKNEQDCQPVIDSLVDYFDRHRAGPFQIKFRVMNARQGFDLMGYALIKNGTDVSILPGPKRYITTMQGIESYLRSCDRSVPSEFIRKLRNSAPACTEDFWLGLEDEVRDCIFYASLADQLGLPGDDDTSVH